jgi:hypothetical protein
LQLVYPAHSFVVAVEFPSISAPSAQTDERRHDTTITDSTGLGFNPIAQCLMILVSFSDDCRLMDSIFCSMFRRMKTGRPRPEVSWWLDNKLVDHTYIGTSENVVQNVLVIPQLQRHHLHAILRCQASNYFGVRNNTPTYTPYPTIAPFGQQQQSPHHSRQQQQQSTIVSSVQLDLNRESFFIKFQV